MLFARSRTQRGADRQRELLLVVLAALSTGTSKEHPAVSIELRVWSAAEQSWVTNLDLNVDRPNAVHEAAAAFRITVRNTGDVELHGGTVATDIAGCTVTVPTLAAGALLVSYCDVAVGAGTFHASTSGVSPGGITVSASDLVSVIPVERPVTPALPVTGSDAGRVLPAAFSMLAVGLLLVALGRRRLVR
jgi:hypothetical protein